MIRPPWAEIAAGLLAIAAAEVQAAEKRDLSSEDRVAFAADVQRYRGFVVAICAPDAVRSYASFNRMRDAAFIRSLRGTELQVVYLSAVRDKAKRDEEIVYHCDGPPLAPDPAAPAPDPRQRAIAREQERLWRAAAEIPQFFDEGDAVFARLIALRDKLLARRSRE